ncbi:MAG: TonB family protein [Bacteroidetes bacterium]|nr:TonB family protein [Bacteroidota bacterium]
MKVNLKQLLLLFLTCVYFHSIAQNSQVDSLQAEQEVFAIVDSMPSFPGGEREMFKYLAKEVKYPPGEREKGLSGRVYVTFVVNADGSLGNIRMAKEIVGGPGFSKEALKAISAMPNWIPGSQRGVPVAVQLTLPISWTQITGLYTAEWHEIMKEGSAQLNLKNFSEAIELFNQALKIYPNQIGVLFERAAAFLNSGNELDACIDWHSIMQHTDQEIQYQKAKAFYAKYCKNE